MHAAFSPERVTRTGVALTSGPCRSPRVCYVLDVAPGLKVSRDVNPGGTWHGPRRCVHTHARAAACRLYPARDVDLPVLLGAIHIGLLPAPLDLAARLPERPPDLSAG